jgi:hypothetical protein
MRSGTRTVGAGGQLTFGICEEEDVLAMGVVVAADIACMGASGMASNKQLARAPKEEEGLTWDVGKPCTWGRC